LKITVTDQPQCQKQLRIEIPTETVRAETDKIAANLARQVNVPGFRRGHVPTSVVKARFRKELRDEMLSHLLPHALGDAIREKDLKVVGEPSIDDLKFGEDDSIDVTFTVEVAPDFELGNYKELPLTRRVYKVTDEDVDKTIERLREGQAELAPVEDRGAQAGDIVTLNVTGRIVSSAGQEESSEESKPEEIRQQDVELELGAEGVLKEFTEGLAGARPGETRTFTVNYPEDYSAKQYAGRGVEYTAEVTAIRVKELPEVNDEFARSIDEKYDSLESMRAEIRSNLEKVAENRTEGELREALMEQLVDRNRFDLPDFIVEKQMDVRLNTLVRQLASQGMDARHMKVDWEQIRESQRERAEREVRGSFILDRIASNESVEVSDEDVNGEIEEFAAQSGQDLSALRARLTKEGALDSIKEQVRNRKALDLVIASANIRTEEVQGSGEQTGNGGEGELAEG
jgi:trigger factor